MIALRRPDGREKQLRPESLLAAARWIEGAREYYLQQYKDSGDVIRPDALGAFTDDEMRGLLEKVRTVIPAAQLRGVG